MKINYLNYFVLLVSFIGFLHFYSCDSAVYDKKSLDMLIKEESIKSQRYDSIIYGVKFGMTYEDFHYYTFRKNREGLFFPSRGGSMVKVDINSGFDYPIEFHFFPSTTDERFTFIAKFKSIVSYKNYSIYNKEMSLNNLIDQTLRFFEEGYKGNNFIKVVNNDDIFVNYNYIKIDANRMITIKPSYPLNRLDILFEDLRPMGKIE